MKQFFLDLKVRSKLLLGFGLIAVILIVAGIRNYNVLMQLLQKDAEYLKTQEASRAIASTMYYLQAEIHNITEIVNSKDEAVLDRWWSSHIDALQGIRTNLNHITVSIGKISYTKNSQTNLDKIITEIEQEHINVNPTIEKIRDKKLRLLSIAQLPASHTNDSAQLAIRKHHVQQIDSLYTELTDLADNVIKTNMKLINKFDEIIALTETIKESLAVNKQTFVFNSIFFTNIIIVFGLLFALFIAFFVANLISGPINKLNERIALLSKGELPDKLDATSLDEIGEMTESLNLLVEGLQKTSEFSYEIGKGNYISEFAPLSEKDVLGNSLLNMRDSLQKAKQDEDKRKLEDEQRNWMTEGLTLFSEILRKSSGNIRELSNNLIIELVKYLKANQGGVFIYNDQDKDNIHLQLLATYAYNRKKFIEKNIKIGEGLVGMCALEKYTMYMTEIPEEYIDIESGLGLAKPTSLLIIPLRMDEQIMGVIELASFNIFAKYEIELVERIAENIASSFSTIKINLRTAQLLEQSQLQAEEMAEQEEEMRQNIEEMQAAQEDAINREQETRRQLEQLQIVKEELDKAERKQRREIERLIAENEATLSAIKEQETQSKQVLESSIDAIITFNKDGIVEYLNDASLKLLGYKDKDDLLQQKINILVPINWDNKHSHILDNFAAINSPTQKGVEIETRINIKSGETLTVLISIVKTITSKGLKYTAFIKDLSKQKQIEAEKNKLMENIMANEFKYKERIHRLELELQKHNIELPHAEYEKLIEWTKEYVLGIKVIDDQHQRWIEIINKLYDAFKRGTASVELRKYFDELLEFTDFHFGFEEKQFDTLNYENKEPHMAEHYDFIKKIKQLYEDYNNGQVSTAYDLMNFLKDWVNFHILVADSGYVKIFKANNIK